MAQTKNLFPDDDAARKAIPIFDGAVMYFPKALAAVAVVSRIGNDQHNPGKPLHWDRSKSGDELDACQRHLAEAGKIDTDNVRHSTKAAWRALANLQKELEAAQRGSVCHGNVFYDCTVGVSEGFGFDVEHTILEHEVVEPCHDSDRRQGQRRLNNGDPTIGRRLTGVDRRKA